ncbi:MAG: histidine--tRNA ligase [Actinomycetales bacterium]|nr:histidine--tRNA ligase [Actinomycetales bacterium]
MSRSLALSGFPEWLPEGRLVEQAIIDTARRVFELHGFASIETRSVEPLEQMLRKGEIDKEVYVLRRLHAAQDEPDPGLGLHFDLTVPFARYVLQHAGHLDFPFRRYQIQKVWRGERPQDGRFREFTQADIDVVDRDSLAFHHEVEMAVVMSTVLAELPIPRAVIHVSNRKLAEGFYRAVGATDPAAVLRAVDRLDKAGPDAVGRMLVADAGLSISAAEQCLAMAAIQAHDAGFVEQLEAIGPSNALMEEGIEELLAVIEGANRQRPGSVIADLRIARGLDYYTGTVYETMLEGHASIGSISSGGRYDALASDAKATYPGVGISLGVSRLVSVLLDRDLVQADRRVPSAVLVAVNDEQSRAASELVAGALRARGIPCEVAPKADRFGKQIRYADRRGIPYVWFPGIDAPLKDIRSGDQMAADPATWMPPAADLTPQIRATSLEQRSTA